MPHEVSRRRFDALVSAAIAELPARFAEALAEVPVEVLDRPDPAVLREMGMGEEELLLGLYRGVPLTERTVEAPAMAGVIHLYRHDIEDASDDDTDLIEQVRVTLLHELGHHFGLGEDDLEELGYE